MSFQTEKRQQALVLLKEGKTIRDILNAVKVSRARLVQWKQDEGFRTEWNKIMYSLGRVYS